jgi:hypothetical protein
MIVSSSALVKEIDEVASKAEITRLAKSSAAAGPWPSGAVAS